MAEVSSSEKEPLTSSVMYLDRVRSELQLKFNTLYWELEYKELECGNKCLGYDPSLGSLLFFKSKESVTVIVSTNFANRYPMEGFFAYQLDNDNRMLSDFVYATKIHDTACKMELPFALIRVQRNKYLEKNGSIVLGIRFNARRLLNTEIAMYLEERDKTDDFLEAYQKQLFTDYVIRARGEEFRVHKAILSARSIYFLIILDETTKEIDLDAKATAVQSVIHYLYSGQLPTVTLDEMIDVYEISFRLGIRSLLDQCTVYFFDILNQDNVGRIRETALRSGNESLIKAANNIYSRMGHV